ncbi:MAG: sigma-70 family RNA polymerase sigma factor [Candidatus Brocadiia bacterium]
MTTDLALLEAFASGNDRDAFARLVDLHAGMVYGTSLRITRSPDDARDITQECFVELARHARNITVSVGGWLHTTAVKRSCLLLRRRKLHERKEKLAMMPTICSPDSTWETIAPRLDEAIDALPYNLRVLVVMHFLDGEAQSEIAAKLGVDQSTVSRRIDRALELLRKNLAAGGVFVTATVLVSSLASATASAAPAEIVAELKSLPDIQPDAFNMDSGSSGAANTPGLSDAALNVIAGGVVAGIFFGSLFLSWAVKSEPLAAASNFCTSSATSRVVSTSKVTYRGAMSHMYAPGKPDGEYWLPELQREGPGAPEHYVFNLGGMTIAQAAEAISLVSGDEIKLGAGASSRSEMKFSARLLTVQYVVHELCCLEWELGSYDCFKTVFLDNQGYINRVTFPTDGSPAEKNAFLETFCQSKVGVYALSSDPAEVLRAILADVYRMRQGDRYEAGVNVAGLLWSWPRWLPWHSDVPLDKRPRDFIIPYTTVGQALDAFCAEMGQTWEISGGAIMLSAPVPTFDAPSRSPLSSSEQRAGQYAASLQGTQ